MLSIQLNPQGQEKVEPLTDARFELQDRGTKWLGADGRLGIHHFELGPEDTEAAIRKTFASRIPGILIQ